MNGVELHEDRYFIGDPGDHICSIIAKHVPQHIWCTKSLKKIVVSVKVFLE